MTSRKESAFSVAFGVIGPLIGEAEMVKQSRAGICQGMESPYYETVKHFQDFESLKDCIQADGRLPRDSLYTHREIRGQAYSRERFGHGRSDKGGDCQNTRREVLIEQSTIPVRFAGGNNCRVV